MSNLELSSSLLAGSALIRNEPVQARSTARLAALLDAAAAVIDEIGYERLTTAMVADRAGASIGTVYRYFPDRIAVLQALAARNSERLASRLADELVPERHATPAAAMHGVLTAVADMFRREPGYPSIRVGDVLDLRPPVSAETANGAVASMITDAFIARFGVRDSAELRGAVATAYELIDAFVARAFARNRDGDKALLAEASRVLDAVIDGKL
ncbi:TetR/AcrR family transcriptional regulator [Microcella alkaliphila]|uniref:Transcriptional regulator, TetR family n=1 Tax=Microcella alkaliphila TaxID=279828 RepID=A0A0U4NUB1_9MICO|nr:TetR/AcrR family transcriptional regulator [Microcella alkaliphila]BAU31923.1 transcriptional regulator, TetR family [Microcella alkaliphila]